jgi:integrase
MMLTGGKSAVVVARQLGHRDARIMTQVYEHLLDDGLLDGALTLSYRDHTGDHAGEEEAAGREA